MKSNKTPRQAKERLNIFLTKEEREQIFELAYNNGKYMSEYVRGLIIDHIKSYRQK